MQVGLKSAKETLEQLLVQQGEDQEPEARISAITRRIDKQMAWREKLVEQIRDQDLEIRTLCGRRWAAVAIIGSLWQLSRISAWYMTWAVIFGTHTHSFSPEGTVVCMLSTSLAVLVIIRIASVFVHSAGRLDMGTRQPLLIWCGTVCVALVPAQSTGRLGVGS